MAGGMRKVKRMGRREENEGLKRERNLKIQAET